MKHFRSFTALLLALVFVLVPFAGILAEEEPAAEWDQLPLGSSGYAIKAPAGYTDQGVTEDEYVLGLVSAYLNPSTGIDIEVGQYAAKEDGFQAFAEAEVALYNGTDYAYEEDFNGLTVAGYRSDWTTAEGETLRNATVLLDAGEQYISIDFYWSVDQEDAIDLVRDMINTLGTAELAHIRLGSSPYFVTVPKGYYEGDVTDEEAQNGMIAYYLNDNLLFDFDVYESTVDEALTLEDVATQLCAADKGTELTLRDINGIPAYTFTGHDEYDGVEYDTVTAILDSTNGSFIGIVCWIDNEAMRTAALGMLNTIATEEELIPDAPMFLRIGSSGYGITLPTTFFKGNVSEEDFRADGYAACYYSPYALFDIDLYQCLTSEVPLTLAEFTEQDAANYNGTEIALDDEINGVNVTSYRSVETYDNIKYYCLSYTFADDEYIYQLCFYYSDEDAVEDIEAAMESLAPIEKTTLQLGSYNLTVPVGMTATPIEYDEPELTATAYKLEPLKFTVYEMNMPENPYTLEQVAEQEVAYYNGTNFEFVNIGDIRVAAYLYTRTDEQYNQYKVLTYCLETDTGYMDIDFEISDYVGMFQALDVMGTLTRAQ